MGIVGTGTAVYGKVWLCGELRSKVLRVFMFKKKKDRCENVITNAYLYVGWRGNFVCITITEPDGKVLNVSINQDILNID